MEVSKNETCLWKIKCCGSSTVTINKQKHIHKNYTMVNIFSSGCYVPYIYIIAAPLHFLRPLLSSIFCFFVALGPSTLVHYVVLIGLQFHMDVDYPI